MHILMITPRYFPFDRPRVGSYYHEHALALNSAGAKVAVINVDLRPAKTLKQGRLRNFNFKTHFQTIEGVDVYKFQGWSFPKSPQLNEFLWEWFCKKVVQKYVTTQGKPDIIHAQRALLAGYAARSISDHLDIPYVVTEHSSGYVRDAFKSWQKKKIKKVFADASAISAVSKPLAQDIYHYTPESDIVIIPNVVRLEKFPPPHARDDKPFRFLTVCNLERNKGVDLILEAFACRFSDRNDVFLDIGGSGPDQARLVSLANELGVGDKVKFLGLLSQNEVSTAMQGANCFLLASRKETFGVVVVEAMSTGLPVISTSSGGPDDIISREMGYIVPVGDGKALSEAMVEVEKNSKYWSAKASNIRHHVQSKFSPQVVGTSLIKFYKQALKK